MSYTKQNYAKYENYIRVGHKADGSDMQNFPTPSSIGRSLKDQDLDAYTDLKGYTQRNRIRHDVEQITVGWNALSDEDEAYILNRISPEWFYLELKDKKTLQRKIIKVYASDKDWNTTRVWYNSQTKTWEELNTDFQVTFTQQ